MKYKIHDFLSDRYFPRSRNVFIPTKQGVLDVILSLTLDRISNPLYIHIFVYEDNTQEDAPSFLFTYEEFIMFDGPDMNILDWKN